MAKVSEYYGGVYLTAAELGGKTHRLQLGKVTVEEVGDEREKKLVASFRSATKGLVLNKTNATALACAWGDETDAWVDRWLDLFTMPVNFNGRVCDGIRVRPIVETAKLVPPSYDTGAVAVGGVSASQGAAAPRAATESDETIPF